MADLEPGAGRVKAAVGRRELGLRGQDDLALETGFGVGVAQVRLKKVRVEGGAIDDLVWWKQFAHGGVRRGGQQLALAARGVKIINAEHAGLEDAVGGGGDGQGRVGV